MDKSRQERRQLDDVAEALATVLASTSWIQFDVLVSMIAANLRADEFADLDEETLRLQIFEELQQLVEHRCVEKRGDEYRAASSLFSDRVSRSAAEHCRQLLVAIRRTPFERAR